MNIKKIEIKGLFNTYNHCIEINETSHLTILLGQNGLGKTALLSLINALFSYDFDKLTAYQYNELVFTFDDGSELKIKPSYNEEQESLIATLTYKDDSIDTVQIKRNRNRVVHSLPQDKYRRVRTDVWSDSSTGEYYTTDEIISLNEELLTQSKIDIHGCPEWLSTVINSSPVGMIDTKRLQTIQVRRLVASRETVEIKDTILDLSKDYTQQIVAIKAKAASIAYDLDRTFPRRLIDAFNPQMPENKDAVKRTEESMKRMLVNLRKLESIRKDLAHLGLMQTTPDVIFSKNFSIGQKDTVMFLKVLDLYFDDSRKKIEVYTEMSKKVTLFIDLINKHYIKKEISVSEEGLSVSSTITKEPIPLAKLSSGEQHLFILFYNLLFKCPKNSMVLMDEPEISLNISWQKSFVSDLMQIMELNPIRILMATHSPSIVRNYWDNTVELSPES